MKNETNEAWREEVENISTLNESSLLSSLSSSSWDQFPFEKSNYGNDSDLYRDKSDGDNWWALLALFLVAATAAGNILVCLAITWERRLQNVTNYFLMSLAITDLMVAILVMPLGILTLVKGKFFLRILKLLQKESFGEGNE